MRRILTPSIDDTTLFDEIAAAKRPPRRALLQMIRANVTDAYRHYTDNAPAVENLPAVAVTAAQAEALVHAYEVETAPMAAARATLTEPVLVARCPFCGIGEASTLDHYLPKEQYPHYAVLSKNLNSCTPKPERL